MLAIVSPAKTLDFERPLPPHDASRPAFEADAAALARSAARISRKRLGELMHISDALAKLNVDRFRAFADLPARPAIHAFAGDVYVGFVAAGLDEPIGRAPGGT